MRTIILFALAAMISISGWAVMGIMLFYSLFIRYLFARSPIEVRNKSEISPKKHRRNIEESSEKVRRRFGEFSDNHRTNFESKSFKVVVVLNQLTYPTVRPNIFTFATSTILIPPV